jgi:tetratricopeptide (TPR) repeat protein
MDLRPGPQVYSRAAHVRWLKGDLSGAVAMMRAAARSVNGRDVESAAWTYSRLAQYELQRGRFDAALQWLAAALALEPGFAPALFARGRIQLARGELASAIDSFEHASARNPLPEYQWALADALAAAGRKSEAERVEDTLAATGAANDARTMALFLATRGEQPKIAAQLARRELKARRDVFTYDALAWALLAYGRPRQAHAYSRRALAEGTEDARLFLHAAVIAAADGKTTEAEQWRQRAAALEHMLLPCERRLLSVFAGGGHEWRSANETRTSNSDERTKEGT